MLLVPFGGPWRHKFRYTDFSGAQVVFEIFISVTGVALMALSRIEDGYVWTTDGLSTGSIADFIRFQSANLGRTNER